MKKLISIGILMLTWASIGNLQAQSPKLIVGERGPDLKVKEWIIGNAPGSTLMLVEFFHSSSQPSVDRLPALDALAVKYNGRLSVVVVSREPREKVAPVLTGKPYAFAAALDDNGKTFAAYQVQFVPFGVLVDGKGRVRWFGNPSDLTESIINDNL